MSIAIRKLQDRDGLFSRDSGGAIFAGSTTNVMSKDRIAEQVSMTYEIHFGNDDKTHSEEGL